MTTYFSDLKPPQTECVFAKHPTPEEEIAIRLKRIRDFQEQMIEQQKVSLDLLLLEINI